jgi:serine kinase of HPr protein (carbohydrate metabolism regulator)
MSQNQTQIHATAVALDGAAALLLGPPGAGKSDLALRCILQGAWIDGRHCLATLVADDQVIVEQHGGGGLVAHPPDAIVGRIEVRGLGIMKVPNVQGAEVALAVELVPPAAIERLPEVGSTWPLLGAHVPLIRVSPFETSAHLKVLLALVHGVPGD